MIGVKFWLFIQNVEKLATFSDFLNWGVPVLKRYRSQLSKNVFGTSVGWKLRAEFNKMWTYFGEINSESLIFDTLCSNLHLQFVNFRTQYLTYKGVTYHFGKLNTYPFQKWYAPKIKIFSIIWISRRSTTYEPNLVII